MSVISTSAVRSKRIGKRLINTASTAALVSGGLIILSFPAYAAESASCITAQADYQNAVARVSEGTTLAGKLTAAHQVAAEAQQTRDDLAAMAAANAVLAQSRLQTAVAAAASKDTDLHSAQENLQRALATARWAAERVDSIQKELDGLTDLNAAAEDQARTLLGAAITARSAAAAEVDTAETALGAAIESQEQPAIDTAQATLLAKQSELRATEAQVDEAERALGRLQGDGEAQLADVRNRLDSAEQLTWELGEHLMQADALVHFANKEARVAADDVSRAEDALLQDQNLAGIAEADAALAAASAVVAALHVQTISPPDRASIDRLHNSAAEACKAPDQAIAQTPPVAAEPILAGVQTTALVRPAPFGLPPIGPGKIVQASSAPSPAPGQIVQADRAPSPVPGQFLQPGSAATAAPEQHAGADAVTVTASRSSAEPSGPDGWVMAAWSLASIFVLAATAWSIQRFGSKRR